MNTYDQKLEIRQFVTKITNFYFDSLLIRVGCTNFIFAILTEAIERALLIGLAYIRNTILLALVLFTRDLMRKCRS